jgi:type II secretory pathway pseudopilin PulG
LRHRATAFTLVEVIIVISLASIAIGVSVMGITEMAAVQKRNAALAETNIALRDQRARALESQAGTYVDPRPNGTLVTGLANISGSSCTVQTTEGVVDLAGMAVGGSIVCFDENGAMVSSTPQQLLTFTIPGESAPAFEVTVFKLGTIKWTGTSLFAASDRLVETSLTVEQVAIDKATLSL